MYKNWAVIFCAQKSWPGFLAAMVFKREQVVKIWLPLRAHGIYPLLMTNSLLWKMARNSWFFHWTWWFSIVILNYQRVRKQRWRKRGSWLKGTQPTWPSYHGFGHSYADCLPFLELDPRYPDASKELSVLLVTALFWVTEVMPLSVSSLLPMASYPLFGIVKASSLSGHFFSHVSFLLIAGCFLGLANERWNLHTRYSVHVMLSTLWVAE